MKKGAVIVILVGLALVIVGVAVTFFGGQDHDPKDLGYWMRAAAAIEWSSEAAQREPRSQFLFGLSLIRTNLVTMKVRVPWLSDIPLFGKRFFEKVSYQIDSNINQEQLAEAYQWIKKSADQGFAPATEAEKLFIGRVGTLDQGGPANPSPRDH